jgi:ParB family chromosome partitioning protein
MADKKKEPKGLGIGALLSNINPEIQAQASTIAEISLIQIEVNPFQPRVDFDPIALQELADSIQQHGLIQPITVRSLGGDKYQLISGERRLRASKLAGLPSVPAFVRVANDEEMLEMALVENIQREELNAIEVAITYKRLMEEFKLVQEDVARRVGKKRETVTNYLRLLKLPETIQLGIQQGKISMGHARALVGIGDFALQMSVFREILEKDLSVRQVEQLAQLYKQNSTKTPATPKNELPLPHQDLQRKLTSLFSTRVQLRRSADGKGQMVIHFQNDSDLNRILDILEQED